MKQKQELIKRIEGWIDKQENCNSLAYMGWKMFSPADGMELESLVAEKNIKEKSK